MARLLSVNVGMPRNVAWRGKTVHTGIWKRPVPGPSTVRRLNLHGDGQGDTAGHGGVNRAVLVYQAESYQHWRRHLGRDDLNFGVFGENFTVDGLPDDEVCIGDRYRIGTAEFEVSQPRVTCFRLGIRLGEPDMPSLLVAHHRPGFYLRVITEGEVRAGDPIERTSAGPGGISVADVDALLYLPNRDPDLLRRAAELPALSPGWRGSFQDLLRADERSGAAPPLEGRPAEPGWAGFRQLRIADVVPESDEVVSIYLSAPDGAELPAARPGQYLTLRVPGAGDPAPVRSYSLSSAPGADRYRISVKQEPNGLVSSYLHASALAGGIVDAAAPRGDFVLRDGNNPVLLISAGIGVTQVLAMLHELAARSSRREVWWLHGARDPRRHPMAAEAHRLLAALPAAHEHIYYTTFPTSADESHPARSGRISAAALAELKLPTDASAYLCGPAGFMADIRQALLDLGLNQGNVHSELFGARDAINPGLVGGGAPVTPHPPAGPPGTGPLVSFARSGLTVPYDAETRPSLLELAEVCDVPTRWACRNGVCHTCVTPLLSGTVSYSPEPLERPDSGAVLPCCARPDSEVVLDM
ncbi:MAG TPA: MOSC and FAD-binding oxidoreductase domain-containing protein [Pseudonocardia sp.]